MSIITVTPEDMKRGKLIEPGWYTFTIKDVTDMKAKSDGSNYTKVTLLGVNGDAESVEVFTNFSEKAPGFVIPFAEALGHKFSEAGGQFDLSATRGLQIRAYIVHRAYQGRNFNETKEFDAV